MTPDLARDLSDRWLKARRSALLRVVAGAAESEERVLATQALQQDGEETLRLVFDHSFRLGQSCARYFRCALPLDELPALLGALGSPCLAGTWRAHDDEPATLLTRGGCPWGASASSCDYWREATDGLVLGLSDGVRHTRHRSVGHGDSRCVDVIYTDSRSALRFGEIPDEMRAPLRAVRAALRLMNSALDVEFLGVSEGVLVYRLARRPIDNGGLDFSQLIEQQLVRRFPTLEPMKWTHRAVLDPAATLGGNA